MNGSPNGVNVNSFIMTVGTAIIMATLGWVGLKVVDSNDRLTALGASMPFLQQTVAELKVQITTLVTRPELESKISEIKVEQTKIQLELLKLRNDATPRQLK